MHYRGQQPAQQRRFGARPHAKRNALISGCGAAAVIALALLLPLTAAASERDFGSASVERVTSIYDGDTFRVDIAGWPALIGSRVPIRLAGADTPEIRAHCDREKQLARRAKQFTVAHLRAGHDIQLEHMRRGKYFRIVADVVIDGQSLAPELINAGLARSYEGGHKRGWCAQNPNGSN